MGILITIVVLALAVIAAVVTYLFYSAPRSRDRQQ